MKSKRIVFPRVPHNWDAIIKASNDRCGVMVKEVSNRTLCVMVANSVDFSALEEELLKLADLRAAKDVEPCVF